MTKKKTELKENLKPRSKTMAQPDIMHDFGELGEWSESTLKANMGADYEFKEGYDYKQIIYINPVIEKTYSELKNSYKTGIDILMSKTYFFPRMYRIYNDFKYLESVESNYRKLKLDYRKYKKVMETLF